MKNDVGKGTSSLNPKTKEKKLSLGEPFRKINVGVKHFLRGRDEHRTSGLCGVSTFLNKLSPAQPAYFKKASIHLQTVAYADPDCCFKGISLADGRMLVGQLFELSGGERGGQYLYF